MKKIGFLGIGHMGGALAQALAAENSPEQIMIYDLNSSRVETMCSQVGFTAASSEIELVKNTEILMLCVKPDVMDSVIKNLIPILQELEQAGERRILCSIAAGVSLKQLNDPLRTAKLNCSVLRIMPNIPVTVREGMLLFAREPGITDQQIHAVMEIMKACGQCEETSEAVLELACPVFSCSPAFAYMFIEALAYGGTQIGLRYDQSVRYAAQALFGAAKVVLEEKKSIGSLKEELCTPGGMTICGINELHRLGFTHAVIQAVIKSYQRQGNLA